MTKEAKVLTVLKITEEARKKGFRGCTGLLTEFKNARMADG